MAHITLQLPDDLAERLAPFQDRLPELLERGLRSLIDEHTNSDRPQEEATNDSQQCLDTLRTLHQLRSEIQAKHGICEANLVAEARLDREGSNDRWLVDSRPSSAGYCNDLLTQY